MQKEENDTPLDILEFFKNLSYLHQCSVQPPFHDTCCLKDYSPANPSMNVAASCALLPYEICPPEPELGPRLQMPSSLRQTERTLLSSTPSKDWPLKGSPALSVSTICSTQCTKHNCEGRKKALTKHNHPSNPTRALAADSIMRDASSLAISRQHDLRVRTRGLNGGDFVRHIASAGGAAVGIARCVGRVVDTLESKGLGAYVGEQGFEHGWPDYGADVAAFGLKRKISVKG